MYLINMACTTPNDTETNPEVISRIDQCSALKIYLHDVLYSNWINSNNPTPNVKLVYFQWNVSLIIEYIDAYLFIKGKLRCTSVFRNRLNLFLPEEYKIGQAYRQNGGSKVVSLDNVCKQGTMLMRRWKIPSGETPI